MSANITTNGFIDVLNFVKTNWKWVELRQIDGTSNVVLPITIPSSDVTNNRFDLSKLPLIQNPNDRFGWVLDTTSATPSYTVTIRLKGTDTDLQTSTPNVWRKISGARLYGSSSSTEVKMEVSYPTPIQFTSTKDTMIITMTLKL